MRAGHSGVAQRTERPAPNWKAAGSTPATATSTNKYTRGGRARWHTVRPTSSSSPSSSASAPPTTATPPQVYDALVDWALHRWPDLIDPARIKRPFWPDGDYEAEADTYTPGDVVIDNPPFSILSKIRRFYQARRIPYILFAPAMTCISHTAGDSAIIANGDVTYHNGASIRTNFVTNLPAPRIFTDPDLSGPLDEAARKCRPVKALKNNVYPPEVIDVARLQIAARLGLRVELDADDLIPASNLDALKAEGRGHFGQFYLCRSDVAVPLAARIEAARIEAARIAKQVTHPLSDRERQLTQAA